MNARCLPLVLGCLLAACGGEEAPERIRFTAIPDQNTTELARKFDPVAEYFAKRLGRPVSYVPSRDYQASVEMFRNGDVQLAWFGGLTGVQACAAVPGAEPIAMGEEDRAFYSLFIAHRDSGLEPSEAFPLAIAGKKFTFGSNSSTSGRLMPESFILEHTGETAEGFFASPPGFSGSHDRTAELVASGQYEAGVLNFEVYDRRVREGKTDPDVVRVIWRTPTYADYHMVAHPDLDRLFGAGTTARLREALLAMDDPALLAAFGRRRMISASSADFDGIRKVAGTLGMLR